MIAGFAPLIWMTGGDHGFWKVERGGGRRFRVCGSSVDLRHCTNAIFRGVIEPMNAGGFDASPQ